MATSFYIYQTFKEYSKINKDYIYDPLHHTKLIDIYIVPKLKVILVTQTNEDKERINMNKTIVHARNGTLPEELKELTLINESFSSEIESIKKNKEFKKKLMNVSYSDDQLKESIARLYLHYSELKISDLIQDFENSSEKDFKIIQKIEDIKKKKEFYLNTI
mgnify:CR=1 FL=1